MRKISLSNLLLVCICSPCFAGIDNLKFLGHKVMIMPGFELVVLLSYVGKRGGVIYGFI